MIPWSNLVEKINSDLKDKGYTLNQIAEMHIITITNKLDMTYGFYIKHNMHAVDWKLNIMLNENPKINQ